MLVTDDVDVLHTATHIITTTKETENANLRIDLKMHVSMCTDTWTMVPTQQDHPCVWQNLHHGNWYESPQDEEGVRICISECPETLCPCHDR